MISDDTQKVRLNRFRELFKVGDKITPFPNQQAYIIITAIGELKFMGKRIDGDKQERAFSMVAYPWVKWVKFEDNNEA